MSQFLIFIKNTYCYTPIFVYTIVHTGALARFQCCEGPICLFVVYFVTLLVAQDYGVSNDCMVPE